MTIEYCTMPGPSTLTRRTIFRNMITMEARSFKNSPLFYYYHSHHIFDISEARKKIRCPVSNNSFGSIWFSMVLVGHGFINCMPSESFVVSFFIRNWEFGCCVLNWKQTALHTDWDQNLHDTSYKLVLFISSLLKTHKSRCYYKAEIMRIIRIPSNTK